MKWLGIMAGVVLAGIVGAVALLPRLIDWNAYRPEFTALAAEAIGRPLVIEGHISADLFPVPQLIAGQIRVPGDVAETDGGSNDIATVRWAEARFKFSDLLRGTVTLTGLALVEPDITLTPAVLDRYGTGPADGQSTGGGTAPALGGIQRQDVTTINIRNGIFRIPKADGEPFLAEQVSGSIKTPAVGRRITVAMTGMVRGRELAMDMRFAPPRQDSAAPVSFSVTDTATGGTLRANGDWSMQEGGPGLIGAFSLNSRDWTAVASLAGTALPPELVALRGTVRMDGDYSFDAGSSSLQVADLSINTAAVSATGGLSLRWSGRPRMDLSLRVGRLELEEIDAPDRTPESDAREASSAAADGGGGTAGSPGPPESGLAATRDELDLMAWLGDLPADVALDLSVAGARIRDTVVRRIAVRGSVDRGTVTLEELSAQLPGGTDLSVAGFGDMTGPEPLLEGNATLRADDLRRLMTWAGLPVPDVSADRLRRFSMVSGISLRPGRLDIIDAAVELDGVTATAAAAVALRRRLGIGVRMTLDHINLDAYRPVALPSPSPIGDPAEAGMAGNRGVGAGGGNSGSGDNGDEVVAGLWSSFDASLDLSVGRAVAMGIPFNEVSGNLVLEDGILTVNEMTFENAAGVSGTFGGQLSVTGDDDTVVLAFEGKSSDLGRMSALLEGPDFVSGFLRSFGPTSIRASYQPSSEGPPLILQVNGEDGGLSLGAKPAQDEGAVPALDILSGELTAGGIDIAGLAGRFTFPPGFYQLEKLSGTLNGGDLNLSGSLRRREDGLQQLLITGALDNMAVDRQLADLDGPIGLTGRISLRGQGEATGSDWRAMTALNNGWFDIDGTLSIDVGPARSSIVKVRQVSETRAALRDSFTQPSRLRGEVALENGALRAKAMTLTGTDGGVLSMTGRLGLDDLALSAELVLRKSADAPQFARLIAEGPAEAPNLRLESAGSSEN